MNTISVSAPPARIRPLQAIAKACRKLGDVIAPRDHARSRQLEQGCGYPSIGLARQPGAGGVLSRRPADPGLGTEDSGMNRGNLT